MKALFIDNKIKGNQKISNKRIYLVYFILLLSALVMNLTIGIFTSISSILKKEFLLTDTISGLLSSSFYWGVVVGNIISVFVIEKNIRKLILIISFTICIVSLFFTWVFSKSLFFMILLRFLNGLGSTFISALNPVFVDQFGPIKYKSMMIAFHNLSVVISVMIGVGLGSLLSYYYEWQFLYFLLCLIHSAVIFPVILIKPKYYDKNMKRLNENEDIFVNLEKKIDYDNYFDQDNSNNHASFTINSDDSIKHKESDIFADNFNIVENQNAQEDEINVSNFQRFRIIFSNKRFLILVNIFTIMLFVSSSLVNWANIYAEEVLYISSDVANISLIVIMITSPTTGILVVGYICSKIGGYGNINSYYMMFVNSIICGSLGLLVFFITIPILFGIILWLFLFFGCMIEPIIVGSLVNTLQLNVKGIGYSLNLVYSNLFGLSLAPLLFGIVYDNMKSYPTFPMSLCMSVPFISSLLCFILIKLSKSDISSK